MQTITLSSLIYPENPLIELSLECPSLVKIDVEGYESNVLKGMEQMFHHDCLPALYFEFHSGFKSKKVVEMLYLFGYSNCYHHIFDYVQPIKNWMEDDVQGTIWGCQGHKDPSKCELSSNMLCFEKEPTSKIILKAIDEGKIVLANVETWEGRQKICNFDMPQCGGQGGV